MQGAPPGSVVGDMKRSAALLVYQRSKPGIDVFLVHPGGPFWAKKDLGAWSIPKGEFDDTEDGLAAARREFFEEVGQRIDGEFVALAPVKQRGGKIVHAWAVEGEVDAAALKSNEFEMEWPPRSGRTGAFSGGRSRANGSRSRRHCAASCPARLRS